MKMLKENMGKTVSTATLGFLVALYFFLPSEIRPLLQGAYAQDNILQANNDKDQNCKIAKMEWDTAYQKLGRAEDRLERTPDDESSKDAVATYSQDLDDANRDKEENC